MNAKWKKCIILINFFIKFLQIKRIIIHCGLFVLKNALRQSKEIHIEKYFRKKNLVI